MQGTTERRKPGGEGGLRESASFRGRVVWLVVAGLSVLWPARPVNAEAPPPQAQTPLSDIRGVVLPQAVPPPQDALNATAAGRMEAARRHLEARDFAPAAAEVDAAVKAADTPTYELLYLLAESKLALNRPGEARLAAEQALACQPLAVDARLLLGRLHRRAGRAEAAVAHLRSATLCESTEPDNPNVTVAWYELATQLAEGQFWIAAAEALGEFDRRIWLDHPADRDEDAVAAILKQHPYGGVEQRLDLLQRAGRLTERAAAAESAWRLRPAEPYLERLYVRALLDAGQAATAFEFCRGQLAASGPGESSAARLGLALETARAVGRLDAWVEAVASEADSGAELGLAQALAERLAAAGDHAQAAVLWRALVRARPADGAAVWALAGTLKDAGDLTAALDVLIAAVRREADEAGPTADLPHDRLAAWMRNFSVSDDFLHQVSTIAARPDCDFATYTVLATTAAAAGQPDLAEKLFARALEERPGFALAHVAWGRMLLTQYRWAEALEHAQQALKAIPQLCAAHLLTADAHAGLDAEEPAEAAYRAALESCPQETAYALALARQLRRTGSLLGAQRFFQQCWTADRTQGPVAEELLDCYLEAGKLDVARELVQQAEASAVPDDTLRRMRTALRFAGAPLQDEHIVELQRQFEQHPDDVTTGLKLAGGLYLRQRPEEADRVLEKLAALAPEDERLLHLGARVALRLLNTERAIAVLERAAAHWPNRATVRRLLADAYITAFRLADARRTLRSLSELDAAAAQRLELREELLRLYLVSFEFDAALALVDEWISAEPDEEAWPRAKARVLLSAERPDEALTLMTARLEPAERHVAELQEAYRQAGERMRAARSPAELPGTNDLDATAQAEKLQADGVAALEELTARRSDFVQVCVEAQAYAAANERLRAWLEERPGDPQVQEWLVKVLQAAKRGDDALDVIGTLLTKSPADVLEALLWRARAHALAGRRDEAVNDVANLLQEGFVQENAAARNQVREELLAHLIEGQEYDRALDFCERWQTATPETDRAGRLGVLLLKRQVLQSAGRDDEALAIAEQFLEIQPYDPGLNNDIGYSWADRGENLERAARMIVLAVSAEPLNAAYLDSLGWAYYKQSRFAAAQEFLARAVQLREGQDATVYDHLGDAEFRLGDVAGARKNWEKAVDLLTASTAGTVAPRDVRLLAAVREKLAALDRKAPPAAAPTAAEQAQEQP